MDKSTTMAKSSDLAVSDRRYPIADTLKAFCTLLRLDPESIVAHTATEESWTTVQELGATGHQLFKIFDAIASLSNRKNLPEYLAKIAAEGPYVPAMFALSSSPTLREGLKRLALLKPFVIPIQVEIEDSDQRTFVRFVAEDPNQTLPDLLACFEVLYMIRCFQIYSGKPIKPLFVSVPARAEQWPDWEQATETQVEYGGNAISLCYSKTDIDIPLLTANTQLWTPLDYLIEKYANLSQMDATTVRQVRKVIVQELASGQCTLETVAERLCVSKRTLQRRLNHEGAKFQQILLEVRKEFATEYLETSRLGIGEIAYMLGYKEPGSFLSAFHTWFGTTPGEYRRQHQQENTSSSPTGD